MITLTFKDLTRDEKRKAISALTSEAFGRCYKKDESGTLYITATAADGQVKLVQIGEDPDEN
jgi:hypothetical protein